NAIPMVQESFDAALAAAKEVADNPQASQEQINSAWITLMNEIHKLGFQKGDKSGLQAAYDEATALDQDEYEDGEAKDNFNLAIENAKAVLDDENAVQSEIDRAKGRAGTCPEPAGARRGGQDPAEKGHRPGRHLSGRGLPARGMAGIRGGAESGKRDV
ncbi:hypothetical protein CLOSTMETH_03954, partial [[Clostridium] methylpentosum DSM 5476]